MNQKKIEKKRINKILKRKMKNSVFKDSTVIICLIKIPKNLKKDSKLGIWNHLKINYKLQMKMEKLNNKKKLKIIKTLKDRVLPYSN